MLNNKVLMSGNQMALYIPPSPVIETETWVIKDTAPVSEDYYILSKQTIPFTSNGKTFIGLELETDGYVINLFYYGTVSSLNKLVATFVPPEGETSLRWSGEDSVYKTITFNESPTGDLLGFKPTRQNNNVHSPRAVYFSIRICYENALKCYKFPTKSSTNLACAQSIRNNNRITE